MEYKRFDNKILLRVDRGEEVLEQLLRVVNNENILSANVSAIGACDMFKVGLYSVKEQKYYSKTYEGEYEIVSFLGNITTKDNQPYIHIHIGCSGEDHIVVGGHLNSCRISGTFECIIDIIDGQVQRQIDIKTGLNILKF